MQIEQIVAQLSEALSKATPGPWCWESVAEKSNEFVVGVGCLKDGTPISGQVPSGEWVEGEVIRRIEIGCNESGMARFYDAEFICLVRNHLPALLADRESLQQKIREQAEALKQCGGAIATFKQKRGNHPGEHVFSEEIQFCLLCDQSYVEAEPALDAVLALPLVREAMTQHEKVATDPK